MSGPQGGAPAGGLSGATLSAIQHGQGGGAGPQESIGGGRVALTGGAGGPQESLGAQILSTSKATPLSADKKMYGIMSASSPKQPGPLRKLLEQMGIATAVRWVQDLVDHTAGITSGGGVLAPDAGNYSDFSANASRMQATGVGMDQGRSLDVHGR